MVSVARPLVTVAIVARNEESTLARAINSVTGQLEVDVAVLVIDDHSSDRTAEIAATLGARVVANRGTGLVDARNTALNVAETDIVVWLDADDRLLSGSLSVLVQPFENDRVGLVAGSPRFDDPAGRYIASRPVPTGRAVCRVVAMAFNPFSQSGLAVRREMVIQLGGYRRGPETEAAEDYDLWARVLGADVEVVGLERHTAAVTVRPSSESSRSAAPQSRRARAIRADLRRAWCDDAADLGRLRDLGRGLRFSWSVDTALDSYALALFRLGADLMRQRQLRDGARVVTAALAIGPIRAVWSARRAALGMSRRRRARGRRF